MSNVIVYRLSEMRETNYYKNVLENEGRMLWLSISKSVDSAYFQRLNLAINLILIPRGKLLNSVSHWVEVMCLNASISTRASITNR